MESSDSELETWIRREIRLDGKATRGARGAGVKRIQEWLNLQGFGIAIDSSFGPVTADAVARFQVSVGLSETCEVDADTFMALVEPMESVLRLRRPDTGTIQSSLIEYANAHLAQHPLEVGGPNMGPWVRLFMRGHEGAEWAWCAGFVTFVMHQAVNSLDEDLPIEGSFSCDSLAAQARSAGLFLSEQEANAQTLLGGSIFLVRRTNTDWTHTGLVMEARESVIRTIEGNTNDSGSREGFEVCARSRGYGDKDFILLSH